MIKMQGGTAYDKSKRSDQQIKTASFKTTRLYDCYRTC